MRYLYIMIIDIQAPDSHNTLIVKTITTMVTLFLTCCRLQESQAALFYLFQKIHIYILCTYGPGEKRQKLLQFSSYTNIYILQVTCSKLIPCYQPT